jgi:hypothetical protein
MIDLSKLSPMCRIRIINAMDKVVSQELFNISDTLVEWKNDGSINTEAGQEMVGWKDALVDLRRQLVDEAK